jgi:hypothetical protein
MPLYIFVDLNKNSNLDDIPQYIFKKGADGLNRMDVYCDGECVASVRFKYSKE